MQGLRGWGSEEGAAFAARRVGRAQPTSGAGVYDLASPFQAELRHLQGLLSLKPSCYQLLGNGFELADLSPEFHEEIKGFRNSDTAAPTGSQLGRLVPGGKACKSHQSHSATRVGTAAEEGPAYQGPAQVALGCWEAGMWRLLSEQNPLFTGGLWNLIMGQSSCSRSPPGCQVGDLVRSALVNVQATEQVPFPRA